jgi:CheY-like chemotaxis protein
MDPAAHPVRFVLIVEDDAANRDLLTAVVRRAGLGARTVTNGLSGLDVLAHGEMPVAVILDLDMPVMNGIEFLGALRKLPAARSVPVILATGSADASGLKDLGVAAVLPKPVDVAKLTAVLQKLVE